MSYFQIIYVHFFKVIFDRFFAFLGLLISSPVFFLIAIAIKIDSQGPVFFCHERVGLYGNVFYLFKFRSMVADSIRSGPEVTKRGDDRITKIGRYLRRYKLDELPQLLNVLLGDISIVGPRPEVQLYVDIFWEDYLSILRIKPGITDYAALEFRDEEVILAQFEDLEHAYISEILPRKIELYKEYLVCVGFLEDIRIIFKTLLKIVWRRL